MGEQRGEAKYLPQRERIRVTWRGTTPHALVLVLWNVGTGVPWPSGLGCAPTALGCTVPAGRPGKTLSNYSKDF
jgi:hypothetical protein